MKKFILSIMLGAFLISPVFAFAQTTNDALIAQLQAQIASLQAQINVLIAQQGGTPSSSVSFQNGDRVEVAASVLAVRNAPTTSGVIVGKVSVGMKGTIRCDASSSNFSCPTAASGYTWWYIDWDNSSLPNGWSAEGTSEAIFLTKIPSVTEEPNPASYVSISVPQTLQVGKSQQVFAKLVTTDGKSQDVTLETEWSSSDSKIVRIGGASCPAGTYCAQVLNGYYVYGDAPGTAVITATYQGMTQQTKVTVTQILVEVSPSITILSPNGGETWMVGFPQTIKWISSNFPSDRKIDVVRLRDSYGKEIYLLYGTINDGFEQIVVPSVPAGPYTLEIKTYSSSGELIFDASDAPFSIVSSGTWQEIGSLSVSLDSSNTAYYIAAAGTNDNNLAMLKFHAANEAINLKKVGLQLSMTSFNSPQDLVNEKVTLWDGATKVGEAIFTTQTPDFATSTLTADFIIPKDGDKLMTIRGSFAPIGVAQPGTPGAWVVVDYDGSNRLGTQGVGMSSGNTIYTSTAYDTASNGVHVFRSYPTVAKIDVTGALISGRRDLLKFKITAAPQGDVGIAKFAIRTQISSVTPGSLLDNINLYAYNDSSFSSVASGIQSDGALQLTYTSSGSTGGTYYIYPRNASGQNTAFLIPAGQTRYFVVRGDVTLAGETVSVVTQLLGDSVGNVGLRTVAEIDSTAYDNFIWSGNSTTTATVLHRDWSSGYLVPGLPEGGFSQTFTGGGGGQTPSIIVLSPNGGEAFVAGSQMTVRWSTQNFPNAPINLYLFTSNVTPPTESSYQWVANIAFQTANDGSETWTIPTNIISGSRYFVRILGYDQTGYTFPSGCLDGCRNDDSDASFSIVGTTSTLKSTIQGYKIDSAGNVFTNPGAIITVSGAVNQTYGTSANPYFAQQIPAGNYTVSSSVPSGYTVSYSLCTNCIDHPASSYVSGNSVSVNAPSGGYADLWWKYTLQISGQSVAISRTPQTSFSSPYRTGSATTLNATVSSSLFSTDQQVKVYRKIGTGSSFVSDMTTTFALRDNGVCNPSAGTCSVAGIWSEFSCPTGVSGVQQMTEWVTIGSVTSNQIQWWFECSSTVAAEQPVTILQSWPTAPSAQPGQSFSLTYNWSGGPTSSSKQVFVHFVNSAGQIVFQDDHTPPVLTNQWSGTRNYTRTITVPASTAVGTYRIMAGLYDLATGARLTLTSTSGSGVIADTQDLLRYQIGTLTVSSSLAVTSSLNASGGFSAKQGDKSWFYMYAKPVGSTQPTLLTNMEKFDGTQNRWQGGDEQYLLLWGSGGHPGVNADAVRRWVASVAGNVVLKGKAFDGHVGCGTDGVVVSIRKASGNGSTLLWGPHTIQKDSTVGVSYDNVSVFLNANEGLDFVISRGVDDGCDSTVFDPTIIFTPQSSGAGSLDSEKQFASILSSIQAQLNEIANAIRMLMIRR
ncbi:MAG: Ser-Thr-rich GPI-anchored membrane family protein [bacterium]|nr:Ser-Thr-rich GPI-anchored membrane family protein [bacterium]